MATTLVSLQGTVVVFGDVGTGKSTIVEKLSGKGGLSSDAGCSFTRHTRIFRSTCGRLRILDTPGANAFTDRLEHNLHIAQAMCYSPVHLLLLVVPAQTRMDGVLHAVHQYVGQFLDLAHLVAVCVTHMDLELKWTEAELKSLMEQRLRITKLVFSGLETLQRPLADQIMRCLCRPETISITADNFLKFFRIESSKLQIIRTINEEVSRARHIMQSFKAQHAGFGDKLIVDLAFEFQAWMTREVEVAQRRLSEMHNFDWSGDCADVAENAGHTANLRSQLRDVLFEVRTMCLGFQQAAGCVVRSCPHCGEVWVKTEGCEGSTTCGSVPLQTVDARETSMNSFEFSYVPADRKLVIMHKSQKLLRRDRTKRGHGCGNTVLWSHMQPVKVPPEFLSLRAVDVSDIGTLPEFMQSAFETYFKKVWSKLTPVRLG